MARSPSETYQSILAGMRSRQRENEDEPSNFERLLGIGLKAGERIFNQVLQDRFTAFQQSEPVLASKQVARSANQNRAFWLQDLKNQRDAGLGDLEYMVGLVREDVKNNLLQARPEAAKSAFGFNELVERKAREEAERYLKIRSEAIALAQKSPKDFEANIDLISRRLRPNSTQNLFDSAIRGLFDGMTREEAEQAQLASLAEYTRTDAIPENIPAGLTPTQLQARRARRLNIITEEYNKTMDLGYATLYADNSQAVKDLKELKVDTSEERLLPVDMGEAGTRYFQTTVTKKADGSVDLGQYRPVKELNEAVIAEIGKPQILDILSSAKDAFGENSTGYKNFLSQLTANKVPLIGDKITPKQYNVAIQLFARALTDPKQREDFFGGEGPSDALKATVIGSGLKQLLEEYNATVRAGTPAGLEEMNRLSIQMGVTIQSILTGMGQAQATLFQPTDLSGIEIPYVSPPVPAQ
jgi:hypothetical protein